MNRTVLNTDKSQTRMSVNNLKPKIKFVNFIQGPGTYEEKISFENKSNFDFVQEQRNRESNSNPSTSRYQKPRYVKPLHDRRTCFHCGDVGHVSYYCQNLQRPAQRPEIIRTNTPVNVKSRQVSTHKFKQVSPTQMRTSNKVDLGRVLTSKALEHKQKGNTFDICSGRGSNSSSELFETRRHLSRKNPKFIDMSLEDVGNYVKHSTTQVRVKHAENARLKSQIEVPQPKAESVAESVNPNVYQKKTLSKGQLWKPKVVELVASSASKSPGGVWVNKIQIDATGQPKTIRAWVPHSN